MQALLSIIGLGLLGIDPIAAIVIASAIAGRAEKYKVLLFTVAFLLGTTVFGVILSHLGQGAIDYLQSFIPDEYSQLWMVVNLVIIAAILVWLTVRFMHRDRPKNGKPKPHLGSAWQFVMVGFFFAFSSFTDPTFYAVIVIAAETHNIFAMAGFHLLWISITQLPLLAVVVAYYFNAHKKLLVATVKVWKQHREKATVILYIAAILLVLALTVDTMVYLLLGRYLF